MLLHFFSILQNRVKTAFLPTQFMFPQLCSTTSSSIIICYWIMHMQFTTFPAWLLVLASKTLHFILFHFLMTTPSLNTFPMTWLCLSPYPEWTFQFFFFFSLMESYWYIKDQLCEFFSVFSKLELLLHPVSTTLCHPLFYLPLWHFNYMHISFPLGCELLEGGIISYSYLFLSVPNTVLKM